MEVLLLMALAAAVIWFGRKLGGDGAEPGRHGESDAGVGLGAGMAAGMVASSLGNDDDDSTATSNLDEWPNSSVAGSDIASGDDDSSADLFADSTNSMFDDDGMGSGTCINPATGLPMTGGDCSGFDVGGNAYGVSNDDLFSSALDDGLSSSDDWSSSSDDWSSSSDDWSSSSDDWSSSSNDDFGSGGGFGSNDW